MAGSNATLEIILGSSVVTTLFTGLVAYFFNKKSERHSMELKHQFESISRGMNTDFEFKKQTTELLGQVYIYLNRSRLAFLNTYSKLKKYDPDFEDQIMYVTNKRIRDLILENGHHIPPELLNEASRLVEHYDAWLVKYDSMRTQKKDLVNPHVYVGTEGFSYPEREEHLFKEKYIQLFNEITNRNPG